MTTQSEQHIYKRMKITFIFPTQIVLNKPVYEWKDRSKFSTQVFFFFSYGKISSSPSIFVYLLSGTFYWYTKYLGSIQCILFDEIYGANNCVANMVQIFGRKNVVQILCEVFYFFVGIL